MKIYQQLTEKGRYMIAAWKRQDLNVSKIAKRSEHHISSINL